MKRKHCYVLCGLGIALLLAGCGNTNQELSTDTEPIVIESQSQEMESIETQTEEMGEELTVTEEPDTEIATEVTKEEESSESITANSSTGANGNTGTNGNTTSNGDTTQNNSVTSSEPTQQPSSETAQQAPTQQTPVEQTSETPEPPSTLNVKENLKFDVGYADYRIITDEYLEIRYYYFYEDGTYWTCYGGFYPESVLNTFQDGFDESMRDNGLEVNGIVYYWSEGGCCWDGTYSVTDKELTFLTDEDGVYNMNTDGNLVNIDTGKMLVLDGS